MSVSLAQAKFAGTLTPFPLKSLLNDLPSCLLLRTLGKKGLGSQDCGLGEAEAVTNQLGGNGAAVSLCMVQGCACLRVCKCVSVNV